jgi:serine phosphatase RsbU (regulator of sigma subunit)
LIRDKKLAIYKGDKQPIGAFVGETLKSFTNNSIDVIEGDLVYIFTDGYADQFGGTKGKKFKYKQFEDLLLAICHLPMEEQKQILDKTIESWMEGHEQVDDMLVIGVRV